MRLPLIPPNELSAERRPLFDDMAAGIEKGFRGFIATREDGAPMGPWNPWLHEPRIGGAAWALTKALSDGSALPEPCRYPSCRMKTDFLSDSRSIARRIV